jgi:hypothetical protein
MKITLSKTSINRGYTSVYPAKLPTRMGVKTKDAGMRLRVERDLRRKFVRACQGEGTPASHVLREFMREYISRLESGQRELFSPDRAKSIVMKK